jgi:hypothetical protein
MLDEWYKDSRGSTIPLLHIGKVVDANDPQGTGRLLVRIYGTDKLDSDQELIECYPLLPKYLNIMPKEGEAVFIQQFSFSETSKFAQKSQRFWIGPIISQLQYLEGQEYLDAYSMLNTGYKTPDQSIDTLPNAKGGYPNKDDIAIQGRENTDLIFKPREILVRAGKTEITDNLKFNQKNPAYIQLKFDNTEIEKEFIDKTVEETVFVPPTHVITAKMRIVTQSGSNLSDNLSEEEYSKFDGIQFFVDVTTKDVKENTTIDTYTNDGNFYTSYEEALTSINNKIEEQQGNYPKWKVVSTLKGVLTKFGEDGDSKTILYPNNTTTKKRVIKEKKLRKKQLKDSSSVMNLVADKINLISHNGEHDFDLTDPENMITNDTQNKINSNAHPLVYGDKLVEFLNLLKEYVKLHVHAYHGLPANDEVTKINLLNFDLETILNKNIKSN